MSVLSTFLAALGSVCTKRHGACLVQIADTVTDTRLIQIADSIL